MIVRVLTATFLLTMAIPVSAETVTWEAAAVDGSDGRHVLAHGVQQYSPETDVLVREDHGHWRKSVLLNEGFALSASVFRESRLDGFGLLIERKGDKSGFSWEWFDRDEADTFRKRQGEGRVRVQVQEGPGYEELASVEFLDDVVLRYLDDLAKPPGTHAYEVTVRKGSVLKVVP